MESRMPLHVPLCRSPRFFLIASLVVNVFVAVFAVSADAQPQSSEAVPPAQSHYMGRPIAKTMHWQGAPWLIRETRENQEQTAIVMREMQLVPGQVVADIGCGNGFYLLQIAQAVKGKDASGQEGKAVGVEIQEAYFEMVRERARALGVENYEMVMGGLASPNLSPASCDLMIMVDVYHEFSHPQEMLASMRAALKLKGVIAILEFRLEDPDVPIKLVHKMSKEQVVREFMANGFKLVRQFDGLPWQHMLFFAQEDASMPAIEPDFDAWVPIAEQDR